MHPGSAVLVPVSTMAPRKSKSAPSGSGTAFKVGVVFIAASVSFMVYCGVMLFLSQDLEDIDGLASPDGGRDVSVVLRESQLRQVPVTLSEAEINQWLSRALRSRQGGLLEDTVSLERVAVRITEGLAEVVMVRRIGERNFTVSMYFNIEQVRHGDNLRTELNLHGGPYVAWLPKPPRGGRFGRLVVPQGFLRLVMPSYESLAEALSEELNNGFRKMVFIRLKDKRIEFDPRIPRREASQMPE